ncbi:nitroreductase family protein [Allomuricauda sp. SCSIO 65647]|uniref:nitroreductase family protein n=1 Tax=Allomuricauda sp. SCSIO 65647 TaxID=2908843 RepID=UPI001F1D15AA|nr:nitroreductase family protein [Muricauda sp. SCSIO 65647]UJH67489.1 nitroreductase family protein [Muricauda sp. SCSIO 65647]
MEKTVTEAIIHRRSVRLFDPNAELDTNAVRRCIENAILAPNSSNLQLWEFHHVISKDKMKELSAACFDQPAAKTAKQLLVVVTRKDLWPKRAKANIAFLKSAFGNKPDHEYTKREKFALGYYKKLIPTVYFDFLGILGWLKYLFFQVAGLFKPVYRQVRNSDMRIVAHKSAALAAQNFMMGMAAIGYDTCPMEGSDTLRIKKILNLSRGAEINMVISCGIRDEKGVYGQRFRVPFKETYFEH